MIEAGNQSMVKKNNQKVIVKYLIKNGATSRADLAKKLKISKPTVSKNVEELIENGILIEVGKGDNELGKKSILVSFNKRFRYVLGIDISKKRFKMALANLIGEVIVTHNLAFNKPEENDIKDIIEAFLSNNQTPLEAIATIGVSYPGIINNTSIPNITSEKNNQKKLRRLTAVLDELFNISVIIKNDINLAIIGEQIISKLTNCNNLLYISVDVGVGAGLIINGKLYEGDRKGAGEVGFTIPSVLIDDTYHNLEYIISKVGLIKTIKKDFATLKETYLYQLCEGKIENVSFELFKEALEHREPYCIGLVTNISRYLGVTIANITALLDIENVILTGDIPNIDGLILANTNKIVNELVPFNTVVTLSKAKDASLIGAVEIAIRNTIEDILK